MVMKATKSMKTTKETKAIERLIDAEFPDSLRDLPRAYRYSPVSIRVRIVDERFRGKNRSEREKMVLPLIRSLPDEVQQDLTILLLLAPEELKDSLMNREYENPTPSNL
jgi:stress-induced morphogen